MLHLVTSFIFIKIHHGQCDLGNKKVLNRERSFLFFVILGSGYRIINYVISGFLKKKPNFADFEGLYLK